MKDGLGLETEIDKRIQSAFTKLCLLLSFNPKDAEKYRELHKLLLEWIKKYYPVSKESGLL